MKKTALFIDGSNAHETAKMLNVNVDYARVRKYYEANLLRAYYYTAILDTAESFVAVKPLVDYLQYNGWTVVSKPTKSYFDPHTGLTKVKGNMDCELIVQAMQLIPYIDHMVLWSGDGDYVPLILAMQSCGIRCDVVSSINTTPAMCSDDLRRACDVFIELGESRALFERPRPPREGKNYA